MPEAIEFDAVVVGAGPAGSSAALALARAGRSVVLVERGPFRSRRTSTAAWSTAGCSTTSSPGGGRWCPVERWVVRRSTMMMTGAQSLSVDFRTDAWGRAPYNGMTTLRCHFDAWLAGQGHRGRGPAGHLHRRHRARAGHRRPGGGGAHRPGRGRAACPGGHRL